MSSVIMMPDELNVLGEPLLTCSMKPLTGFTRSGCCETGPQDLGTHTVCAIVTREFLEFSRSRGNDLISPKPMLDFPGLKPGDRWCLCVSRWVEAFKNNMAPRIIPEASHIRTLDFVPFEELIPYFANYDTK